jgi:hypothetical protein
MRIDTVTEPARVAPALPFGSPLAGEMDRG